MLPATAFFLPVEQVEEGFKSIMDEVGDILLRFKSDDEVSEKVEQFACSFQNPTLEVLAEPHIKNTQSGNRTMQLLKG